TSNIQYVRQCNTPIIIASSTVVVPTVVNGSIMHLDQSVFREPVHIGGLLNCCTKCYFRWRICLFM
uniref:Uncharacterized protein n=1 Tax=Amphimedon queenslandica TaxID=400682 RepID=A0A1X7VRH1_AMPQE